MSDEASVEPLRVGGAEVGTFLRRNRAGMTDQILDEITARISLYADLPPEVLGLDIREVVRTNLAMFESGIGGTPLDASDLERLMASSYRRAEEGIPLPLVLTAYLVGARTGWMSVTEPATPSELDTVREMGQTLLTHLIEVLTAVSTAYLEELEEGVAPRRSAREALVDALLLGDQRGPELASAAGVTLVDTYAVIGIRLDARADEEGTSTARMVASRRKLRDVREALARAGSGDVISRLDSTGGVVLVPLASSPAASASGAAAIGEVVEAVNDASRTRVTAAVSVAGASDLPAAGVLVRDILDVVASTRRPPGVYRLEDVLLEFQLLREGPALDLVRATVGVLGGHPHLVETLTAYLEAEYSRSETAHALNVHVNTLDYRLSRIRTLTGLNPSKPNDLALLHAGVLALAVRTPQRSDGSATDK